MSRFKEFDFTHGAWVDANPKMKEVLLACYKKPMNGTQFVDMVLAANIKSRFPTRRPSGNGSRQRKYRNPHAIMEVYERLDNKFNFFRNYPDDPK